MASPRRSPRLKGLSPAPKGPGPKPLPPRRRVKDPAEDSVRQAVYAAELAAWEQASKEHAEIMKVRHRAKTTAWKAARKKSAAETRGIDGVCAPTGVLAAGRGQKRGSGVRWSTR